MCSWAGTSLRKCPTKDRRTLGYGVLTESYSQELKRGLLEHCYCGALITQIFCDTLISCFSRFLKLHLQESISLLEASWSEVRHEAAVHCENYELFSQNHKVVGAGKDHEAPATPALGRASPSRSGCPGPHPAHPWALLGVGASVLPEGAVLQWQGGALSCPIAVAACTAHSLFWAVQTKYQAASASWGPGQKIVSLTALCFSSSALTQKPEQALG